MSILFFSISNAGFAQDVLIEDQNIVYPNSFISAQIPDVQKNSPSIYNTLESSPSFVLENYEGLNGTNLHFSGWLDYNDDSNDDMIFIVEFNNNLIPYDLIILDGVNYEILNTYKNIAENNFDFTYRTYFIPNQAERLSDLLLTFKSPTTNLCKWVFIGTTSNIASSAERDCLDYQFVLDWDGNRDLEILRFNDGGNFWTQEINNNLVDGATGNLVYNTGIQGEFENFHVANFTGDAIPDFFVTQSSPDQGSTQLYLIDGLTLGLISNTTLDSKLDTVLPLNIDNTGIDELVYISSTTGELFAKNITGFNLLTSTFQSGYSYEIARVIPDVNDDGVEDILLVIESSSILFVGGANGQILSLASHTNGIENSIRKLREVSIGQFGDDSYFAIESTDQEVKILAISEGEKIELLTQIPWDHTLLGNKKVNVNPTEYLINNQVIDFNVNLDHDGLTAIDEFFLGTNDQLSDTDGDSLTDIEETRLGLNPISKDSDGDGMPDNFEVEWETNYFIDDSEQDYDDDGLDNLSEYLEHSEIDNPDTDGDGLPDGWEFDYGYNFIDTNSGFSDTDKDNLDALEEYRLGTNPLSNDTDGDQIPDDWEVKYDLNPNAHQNQTDFDGDGLSALEEYQNDTNPTLRDTDGDGLLDGYEVRNGLDPTRNDAGDDKDNDFLRNKWEKELGTNPNGRFDQYISIFVLTILFVSSVSAIVGYRKLSLEAKSVGFSNYLQMRAMKKCGFTSLHEFDEAQKMGFNIHEAKVLFNSYGVENVDQMILQWKNLVNKLQTYIQDPTMDNVIKAISQTQTLSEYETSLQSFKGEITQSKLNIKKSSKMISEIDTIIDLIVRSKISPFVLLESSKITKFRDILNEKLNQMKDIDRQYSEAISSKDKWFKPWPSLLTIIQMSADKSKLDLEEIKQVLNTDADHAKKLIKAVLTENPLIGSYSDSTNQFVKGTGVDEYLKFVLDKIGEDED